MTNLLKKMTVWFLVALLLASPTFLPSTGVAHAQKGNDPPAEELRQRPVFPKPVKTTIVEGMAQPQLLVVKFSEGTRIRWRDGALKTDSGGLSEADLKLQARAGLKPDVVEQQVASVNELFKARPNLSIERFFTEAEEQLDDEKLQFEAESGDETADLNLFLRLYYKDAKTFEAEALLDQLNAYGIVELAYAQLIGYDAQTDIAPRTGDFRPSQQYRNPAPNGIDAVYANSIAGGRGTGVRLIDIEQGWQLDHEDLPPTFHTSGMNVDIFGSRNHGTAVLGVIAAAENAYGNVGIVPETQIGVASAWRPFFPFYDMAGAINEAVRNLNRGDVILIEQHYPGPRTTLDDLINRRQTGFVPVEFALADFEAISRATRLGMIVVEAAGNGAQNLDDPLYEGRFSRTRPTSGALMVGAGRPFSLLPEDFSNFGSRVDLQAWGERVATLGYGDAFNPGDDRQKYTFGFSGTSSASPIVAGAVCAVQGIRRASGLPVMSAGEMLTLLVSTGQAEPSEPVHTIGRLPNLRAAIAAMGLTGGPRMIIDRTFTVRESDFDVNTGIDVQPGDRVVFTASGEIWSGVLFTFANDPLGWGPENPGFYLVPDRSRFPMPSDRLFSLIGKLGTSPFPIRRGAEIRPSVNRRLSLRINDDVPGNGSGAFTCRVQVWR